MADEEQLAILRQGPEAWNAWYWGHRIGPVDLSWRVYLLGTYQAVYGMGDNSSPNTRVSYLRASKCIRAADLCRADLRKANLSRADLADADLASADLSVANLSGACLSGADLSVANLSGADLSVANLWRTNLVGANLHATNLVQVYLVGADLTNAGMFQTILGDLHLGSCKGLDSCAHVGPSIIDHQTLRRSGPLPLAFLRGVGLPDNLIDYLPSLLSHPIQFYSCFISYSSKDQTFVERLHADLQAKGVRCWFAPHDMPIGAKILDAIDEAIRLRDKVLLVLSEGALASDWVEGEVTRALDEERGRKKLLLFPVRVDDTVLTTGEAWARLLRGQRSIGDFTRWKDHDAYSKGLERLLRDLKIETGKSPDNPSYQG